jgi:hypothetical protein
MLGRRKEMTVKEILDKMVIKTSDHTALDLVEVVAKGIDDSELVSPLDACGCTGNNPCIAGP